MKIRIRSVVTFVLLVTGCSVAIAQEALSPTQLARAKALALEMCVALQEQADRIERQDGQSSGSLRQSFALKAGLDGSEADAMVRAAARLRAKVGPLDERAHAIIRAARRKFPGGRLEPGVTPPPPPPELIDLQHSRDAAVEQAVQELDRELGPAGLAKLNTYLTEQMLKKNPGGSTVRIPGAGTAGRGAMPDSPRREAGNE